MRISFLKIVLAVSLIFNLSVLGAAGYFYFTKNAYWVSPFGVKMPKDKFLFEELSLQPDQMKRMREKAIPFRAEIDRKREEIAARRGHLFSLMRADTPDANAIKATVAEISRIQQEVEGMVTTHILQEKATLDKDQQKKFLDLIENAMSKGKQPGCPPILLNH
jgi:Spy/CpxP family protein refolding chaperone